MVDCAFTYSKIRWTVRFLRVKHGGLNVYIEFYLGEAWWTVRLL